MRAEMGRGKWTRGEGGKEGRRGKWEGGKRVGRKGGEM